MDPAKIPSHTRMYIKYYVRTLEFFMMLLEAKCFPFSCDRQVMTNLCYRHMHRYNHGSKIFTVVEKLLEITWMDG